MRSPELDYVGFPHVDCWVAEEVITYTENKCKSSQLLLHIFWAED